MRVMVIVKATKNSEAGEMPSEKLLTDDGQVQRGAREGRHHAGGRRPSPQLKGKRVRFVGRNEDRHRRPVRRDQGADRGFLALAGEVDGRGGRVGEALPRSDARRRGGDRDPSGLRGRGLRRGVHAGAARARRSACARRSMGRAGRKSPRRSSPGRRPVRVRPRFHAGHGDSGDHAPLRRAARPWTKCDSDCWRPRPRPVPRRW